MQAEKKIVSIRRIIQQIDTILIKPFRLNNIKNYNRFNDYN